jgi:hypothetical protein
VNFVTLTKDIRKKCDQQRKEAARRLPPPVRGSAEQAAREWLSTVEYTVLP